MKILPSFLAIILGALFCAHAAIALAQSELIVPLRSQDIVEKRNLGTVQEDGIGLVELVASRNGKRVIIHALGNVGEVLGKADTFIGLSSTPIYIKTPSGLKKIDIVWAGQGKKSGQDE